VLAQKRKWCCEKAIAATDINNFHIGSDA
jgi:hypothetical protein